MKNIKKQKAIDTVKRNHLDAQIKLATMNLIYSGCNQYILFIESINILNLALLASTSAVEGYMIERANSLIQGFKKPLILNFNFDKIRNAKDLIKCYLEVAKKQIDDKEELAYNFYMKKINKKITLDVTSKPLKLDVASMENYCTAFIRTYSKSEFLKDIVERKKNLRIALDIIGSVISQSTVTFGDFLGKECARIEGYITSPSFDKISDKHKSNIKSSLNKIHNILSYANTAFYFYTSVSPIGFLIGRWLLAPAPLMQQSQFKTKMEYKEYKKNYKMKNKKTILKPLAKLLPAPKPAKGNALLTSMIALNKGYNDAIYENQMPDIYIAFNDFKTQYANATFFGKIATAVLACINLIVTPLEYIINTLSEAWNYSLFKQTKPFVLVQDKLDENIILLGSNMKPTAKNKDKEEKLYGESNRCSHSMMVMSEKNKEPKLAKAMTTIAIYSTCAAMTMANFFVISNVKICVELGKIIGHHVKNNIPISR